MTGYIRPLPSELKLREYRYYRGAYCGLCHAMGKCTGQCSRLTLSYDMTFLVLLRLALTCGNPLTGKGPLTQGNASPRKNSPNDGVSPDGGDFPDGENPQGGWCPRDGEENPADEKCAVRPVTFSKRRCPRHPLLPRLSLEDGDAVRHAACVSAILTYYKLLDDRADESGWKRFRAGVLAPCVRGFSRRAERCEEGLSALAEQGMRRFSEAERQEDFASADRPAQAFGELLAGLFAYGLYGEHAVAARHIGVHLGRWLYLIDAADDYTEDARRGRPNALHRLYDLPKLTHEIRMELQAALLDELRQCKNALDLIEIDCADCGRELEPLLYHMFDEALPAVTGQVLFSPNKKRKEKTTEQIGGRA